MRISDRRCRTIDLDFTYSYTRHPTPATHLTDLILGIDHRRIILAELDINMDRLQPRLGAERERHQGRGSRKAPSTRSSWSATSPQAQWPP